VIAVDDFFIDRVFQPLSEWLTHLFRRNCFWWAGQAFILSEAADLFRAASRALEGHLTPTLAGVTVFAFLWLAYLFSLTLKGSTSETALNPYRPRFLLWRFFSLLIDAPLLVVGTAIIAFTRDWQDGLLILREGAYICGLYFMACQARTPLRRRAPSLAWSPT
jgi:hypothetical protein